MQEVRINGDHLHAETLARSFLGAEVKMFLVSGVALVGTITNVHDGEAIVENHQKKKRSWVNLHHVVSIAGQ